MHIQRAWGGRQRSLSPGDQLVQVTDNADLNLILLFVLHEVLLKYPQITLQWNTSMHSVLQDAVRNSPKWTSCFTYPGMCAVRTALAFLRGPLLPLHFKHQPLGSKSRKTHGRGLPLSQLTICSQMLVVKTWFFSSFKEKERTINMVYTAYRRGSDTIIHAGIGLLGLLECVEIRRHHVLPNTRKQHFPRVKLFSLFWSNTRLLQSTYKIWRSIKKKIKTPQSHHLEMTLANDLAYFPLYPLR